MCVRTACVSADEASGDVLGGMASRLPVMLFVCARCGWKKGSEGKRASASAKSPSGGARATQTSRRSSLLLDSATIQQVFLSYHTEIWPRHRMQSLRIVRELRSRAPEACWNVYSRPAVEGWTLEDPMWNAQWYSFIVSIARQRRGTEGQ